MKTLPNLAILMKVGSNLWIHPRVSDPLQSVMAHATPFHQVLRTILQTDKQDRKNYLLGGGKSGEGSGGETYYV